MSVANVGIWILNNSSNNRTWMVFVLYFIIIIIEIGILVSFHGI